MSEEQQATRPPEMSEWNCELFGMGDAIVVNPAKGNVPNRFWRWMQFICFGNRWVFIDTGRIRSGE